MNSMEMMGYQEHLMCNGVSWDPTGRYVVTFVSTLRQSHSMENGYNVYNSQGVELHTESLDKFYQFVWRCAAVAPGCCSSSGRTGACRARWGWSCRCPPNARPGPRRPRPASPLEDAKIKDIKKNLKDIGKDLDAQVTAADAAHGHQPPAVSCLGRFSGPAFHLRRPRNG